MADRWLLELLKAMDEVNRNPRLCDDLKKPLLFSSCERTKIRIDRTKIWTDSSRVPRRESLPVPRALRHLLSCVSPYVSLDPYPTMGGGVTSHSNKSISLIGQNAKDTFILDAQYLDDFILQSSG